MINSDTLDYLFGRTGAPESSKRVKQRSEVADELSAFVIFLDLIHHGRP